jgi:hypothetical protein
MVPEIYTLAARQDSLRESNWPIDPHRLPPRFVAPMLAKP